MSEQTSFPAVLKVQTLRDTRRASVFASYSDQVRRVVHQPDSVDIDELDDAMTVLGIEVDQLTADVRAVVRADELAPCAADVEALEQSAQKAAAAAAAYRQESIALQDKFKRQLDSLGVLAHGPEVYAISQRQSETARDRKPEDARLADVSATAKATANAAREASDELDALCEKHGRPLVVGVE